MEDESELLSRYSPNDWLNDYRWYANLTTQPDYNPEGMDIEVFEKHFHSTRPEILVAHHCMERFVAAMSYLDENREAINFGNAGVVGDAKMMVSKAVIVALYRFFAGRPDNALNMDIPRGVFQAVIKEELQRYGR